MRRILLAKTREQLKNENKKKKKKNASSSERSKDGENILVWHMYLLVAFDKMVYGN